MQKWEGRETMRKVEILLALSEEDLHSLMTVGLALENMGYHVTMAKRSLSAIEMCHSKTFDLLITDLLIVLEKTKEMNPETMTILILKHHQNSFPSSQAFRFDPDDYLFEPFELDELGYRVENCIKKREPKRKLNEKVLNLLKMMSHDLRGSLVSISATLKLLSRGYYGRMDEGAENQVKELLGKVAQLIGMSEECLGRALSGDGHLDIRQEVLDLRKDVIHPVLEELSSEIKDHHMRIDNRLERVPARRIPIKANRVWLKAIFRNLLKNAIQYGDSGGTITFGFEIRGSSYQLNVFNSGKPIPEGWRDKLFTKVSHMRNTGPHSVHGMGIGLYLIKRIIHKLGGNIWAKRGTQKKSWWWMMSQEFCVLLSCL